jgi:hypothetical protein
MLSVPVRARVTQPPPGLRVSCEEQPRQAAFSNEPEEEMAKVVCVLYDDPVTGYPKSYARDDIPKLQRYPGGQT